MNPLFIPARLKFEVNKKDISKISKKLPKNISIVHSIQYESQAKEIKRLLKDNHKITGFTQILGCLKPKLRGDAVLLIGDGKFHAISLAYEVQLPIYIYNTEKLQKISEKDLSDFQRHKKSAYLKFLNAKKVGILISTKPGQDNLNKAFMLKKKLKKESYLFICNNVNTPEFENFPEIQSWINTACPRLDMNDTRIVNFKDIKL